MQPRTQRRIALALGLALLVALVVAPAPRARAETAVHCVSASGAPTTPPCSNASSYQSIQAAIGASHPGDEIRVAAGTYVEAGSSVVSVVSTALTVAGGYADDDWATSRRDRATIIDAQSGRRGIYIGSSTILLRNLTVRNGVAGSPGNYQVGAGILAEQNQQHVVTLEGVTLQNNRASGSGGGAAIFGPLLVHDSTVRANTSGEDGGGLWGPRIEVYGGELSDNVAAREGGAVFGASVVDGGSFKRNRATSSGGGAVVITSSDARVSGATFEDNEALGGGAIFRPANVEGGSLTIERAAFLRNKANSGGAVMVQATTVSPAIRCVVTDSRFEANRAEFDGGALVCGGYNGSLAIANSTFRNNTAAQGSAGAIGASLALTLRSVELTGNSAGGDGGAIQQNNLTDSGVGGHPLRISGATFTNNRAGGNGGAIFWREAVTLGYSTLAGNQAGGGGGALFVPDSSPGTLAATLDHTRLVANSAGQEGGAARLGGQIMISATQILSNTAGATGGALHVFSTFLGASTLTMTGATLANNRGGAGADALSVDADSVSLRNVTIGGAALAPHEAIYLSGGFGARTATLRNTVVTSHTVGISRTADLALAGDYNTFFQNGADQLVGGAPVALPWAHPVAGDPLFVNPAAHDLRLRAGSPLLDAGDPGLGYSGQLDAEGQLVTAGGLPDVGGDETVSFVGRAYLPLLRAIWRP